MRSIPTFVDAGAVLRVPLSKRAAIYGRCVAGVVAAAGAAMLMGAADSAHANSASSGSPNSGAVYTVKLGDTLSDIAVRKHISVVDIASANAITNIDKIVAGQRLLLPSSRPVVVPVAVKSTTSGVNGVAKAGSKLPVFLGVSTPSPGGPLPPQLAARSERVQLRPHFIQAAKDFNVSADLLQSLAWHESGWQNQVVSSAHAMGIGQLIPDTVTFINQNLLKKPLDPKRSDHNIRMSAAFLRYLMNQTNGDVPVALGAYYQGLASVKARGFYSDTEQYIRSVLAVQKAYF